MSILLVVSQYFPMFPICRSYRIALLPGETDEGVYNVQPIAQHLSEKSCERLDVVGAVSSDQEDVGDLQWPQRACSLQEVTYL